MSALHKRTRDGGGGGEPTLTQSLSDRELAEAFERRREKSDAIRTEVTEMVKNADAEALLDTLYDRWELDATRSSIDDFSRLAFANFSVEGDGDVDLGATGEFGLRQLDETIERHEQEAIAVFHAIKQLDPKGERPELHQKATKVIEMVYYAKRLVLSAFQARLAVHELHCAEHKLARDLDMLLGSWTLRFRWMDQTRSTPLQKLLLHLLDTAMEKRYRKHNGFVYEPIVVNGYETHAWRLVCDIKEFVYESAKKEMYWEQWCNLTASGNNARSAVEHLSASNDYQFPFLHKNRTVFSFRNGVYVAHEDRFHRFAPDAEPLSDTVVAARFFDDDFDPYDDADDWRDIPTPNLQCIMEYQKWEPAVCDWLYVTLGRLLYNVNERDGWQVIPFMLGAASSGKCLSSGTPIMLHDGTSRAVEDVRVGDLLMGDDGTPRRVLTLARGVDDMFDIVPKRKGYPAHTVTREHVLCLQYSNQGSEATWRYGTTEYGRVVQYWDARLNTARSKKLRPEAAQAFKAGLDREQVIEMTVAEYMALPAWQQRYLKCYRVATDFALTAEPLFDPWLIGVWLGDGTSASTGITTADAEIVDGISQVLADTGAELRSNKHKYRFSVSGTSSGNGKNPFLQALRAYDLVDNKHIPHALKTGSRTTRMELLAGLLDTDGWYNPCGYYEITQKNRRLADDIVFVARSLGFGVTLTPVTKACTWKGEKREGQYFRVNVFGAGLADIPVRLERKRASADLKPRKDALRWGFDVRPAGTQPYYGFETDGNHRFLLGDFSVTHNSTVVLKVAKMFYEHADVGVLSNNIEKQFGISAFHDKMLFCGPEIKGDLKIEQAEFQSIVSGESVQVAAKHKKAFTVEWTVPGILAGNEVPSFSDNAGSVQRRFLVFSFLRAVTNGDMKLGEKLAAELPRILLKCNRAYLDASARWGSRNVWTVLPTYFHATRNEMAQAVNSVEAFLASSDVVLDGALYCPMKEFVQAWKAFSISNGYPSLNKPHLDSHFTTPFQKFGLQIDAGPREYRGVMKNSSKEKWVLGVDLADDGGGGFDLG
jgi:hypothetical protein